MSKTILILVANPKDTPHLRLDQEVREIDNGLQRARRRDEFNLRSVWAVRPIDLRRAMLDTNPQIVHFCGHGAGEEGIAFEDASGNAKLISPDVLADFFELFADKVHCVVLNACYSEIQAKAIAQHVKFVVGMKKDIDDNAAIEFAVAFYDALGAGQNVQFAYKLACNAIRWAGIPEDLTPTLVEKASTSSESQRRWLREFPQNPAVVLEEDWEPFCQHVNGEGVDVTTEFVNIPPRLPKLLEDAREKLSSHVPDERSLENPDDPFNGPRYYLRKVITDVRRQGEKPSCILQFGPSDYRTFLVTNGIDSYWAKLAGLADEWTTSAEWTHRWLLAESYIGEKFFENSFGVNVLITCWSEGNRYALFCERGGKVAIGIDTTVGSADEGLRRRFGEKLFDEKSETDSAPDIIRAAYRAVWEEIGLSERLLEGTEPILVSVGRVRSLYQPGALVYWPLKLSVNEIRHCAQMAQDRHYEIGKMHFVPFTRDGLIEFVLQQERHAPVATWTIAMAIYSLGTQGVKKT